MYKSSDFSTSSLNLLLSGVSVRAVLMSGEWYLIVSSICISLITNDSEWSLSNVYRLCMYLLWRMQLNFEDAWKGKQKTTQVTKEEGRKTISWLKRKRQKRKKEDSAELKKRKQKLLSHHSMLFTKYLHKSTFIYKANKIVQKKLLDVIDTCAG